MPDPLVPNLASVAKMARVSLSTASRGLRGSTKISAATQERLRKIAERVGYRPNPYVNILMSHVRHGRAAPYSATCAWLDRSPLPNAWRQNHVQRLFYQGASARAVALGFKMERIMCGEAHLKPGRLANLLLARGILGVLCTADKPNAKLLELPLNPERFAIATVGCRFVHPHLHFSTNDQFITAAMGHRKLMELGYDRIGFITTRQHEEIVDYRFSGGYLSAVAGLNRQVEIPIYYLEAGNESALRPWLGKYKPDAVLVVGDIDGLRLLQLAGARVPRDVALAVLDWHDGLPGIAGISQDHARVGAGAVDMMVSQIRRNEFGVPTHAQGVFSEGTWVNGKSAPGKPGSA